MLSRSKLLTLALTLISAAGVPSVVIAQQDPAPPPPAADPAAPVQAPTDTAQPPADLSTAPAAAAPDKQAFGEEIVVTGSRVRRKELTTPAPVAVISREQIQASGQISLGDFLQSIPEQGNALNTTVNNGGDGSTQISLRSLGSQRTLVLIDGKRFISGVPGGGNLGDPGADLNAIPAGAVERIEILKDGASALYGSDAIGGVVNIITRKRFNAVEASVNSGTSQHGDGSVTDVSVLGGSKGDRGSFSFGAGYLRQSSMAASARGWSTVAQVYDYAAKTEAGGGSSRIPQGRALVNIADPACSNTLCSNLKTAYGSLVAPNPDDNNSKKQNFMPVTSLTDTPDAAKFPVVVDGAGHFWRAYDGATDAYNFQAVNFLITPSERMSLYSNGDYALGDNARAYFHATYVNRQSSNLLAAEPFDTGSFGLTLAANNAFNPFGVDLSDARRRIIETGGRSQTFDLDTLHAFAGVDGTLPDAFGPLSHWFYDFSFGFARNNSTTTTNGSLNTQLIGQAIGPSVPGTTNCADASGNAIAGCTSANLFGGPSGSPLTPAMIAGLGGFTGINRGANQMASAEFNLSGELFKLAAEQPVSLAVGYAYRAEYGFFTYNPIAVAGNDTDYNGLNTAGRFHVNEGYGELVFPVVSNLPFADYLEGSAAVRVSDYNTFGSTATYKLGARYRPIRDVTLRGTYATGFRAPGITSLFGGNGPNAEAASDPCGVNAPASCSQTLKRGGGGPSAVNNHDDNTQILSTSGGNVALQPEKSKGFTIGLVLEPSMVKNVTFTADYFNINIDNNIDFITTPIILAGCYPTSGTPNPAFCDLIQRGPNGQIRDVTDVLQNVGKTKTQGLDLAARYMMPTPVGRFGLSAESTFLFQYDQTLGDGTIVKGKGTYDLAKVLPDYKFNLGVQYALGGFGANVNGRFIGGFKECADPTGASSGSGLCYVNNLQADGSPYPAHNVGLYNVWDANVGYTAKLGVGETSIGVGVRNLFNTDPPRVYNTVAQTNSDPTTYDYVGRFFYARLLQKF